MAIQPKLNTGIILMMRHRATNYRSALRNSKTSDLALNELRTLLTDMLDPDIVLELTEAWLRQKEWRAARAARERRCKKEPADVGQE